MIPPDPSIAKIILFSKYLHLMLCHEDWSPFPPFFLYELSDLKLAFRKLYFRTCVLFCLPFQLLLPFIFSPMISLSLLPILNVTKVLLFAPFCSKSLYILLSFRIIFKYLGYWLQKKVLNIHLSNKGRKERTKMKEGEKKWKKDRDDFSLGNLDP